MFNKAVGEAAVAHVRGGTEAPYLYGDVRFYQKRGSVLVVANISRLPESEKGFFAFHIHEGGGCTGEDFADTGGHYNPQGTPHPVHAGDLPPLLRCDDGAYMAVLSDRFTVSDIIGKTVVIHSGTDDFATQPAGNAGEKIACGVIMAI